MRLATGETFENQAFRYGGKAYGIQFHPEVTRLTMHRWGVLGAHRFVLPNAQDARAHLDGNLLHDDAVKHWLSRLPRPLAALTRRICAALERGPALILSFLRGNFSETPMRHDRPMASGPCAGPRPGANRDHVLRTRTPV